ncbi:peptidoglycan-binding protein [Streptomyces sp. NPDC059832]|uniref:peptidoglycan-binding domain-containing protein n=1 Tax=Streptomyces sp. NPDC059832 TaxID=3346966 RepID=UPI003649FE78
MQPPVCRLRFRRQRADHQPSESDAGRPSRHRQQNRGHRRRRRHRRRHSPAQTPAHRPGTASRTWPLVKSGAEGETVAAIQLLLTAHGYRTDVDAEFGPATTAHVTSYQRDRSLVGDGIVGPDTWHALIVSARDGDKGPAVQALQRLLTAHSHPVSVNGVFDQETTRAVTDFQTEHQLTRALSRWPIG